MLSIEGIIVNTNGQKRGRIEIDQQTGLIMKISEPTGTADILLKDELIFPGFIDLHVHAREDTTHRDDYKEDFTTAGEAAINGGVVAFAEMPNNPLPPIDDASYEEKKELSQKCAVTVLPYALIEEGTKALSKKVPYKAVLGTGFANHKFFSTYEDLDAGLSRYRGEFVSFHCEDPKVLAEYAHMLLHEDQRPHISEITAVDLILPLIKKHALHGKICHCSTIGGVGKVLEARKEGQDVTIEVSPHHLYFDTEMLTDNNRKMLQVNPPIRHTKENRLAVIDALRCGDIDYLATDHAPHTIEDKKKGISGIPELDTFGPFVTWLMNEHNFTPEDIARVCSYNPGKFLNTFRSDTYGKIEKGYVGSLTVIDMNTPTVVNKEYLKTKCGWSPFEGVTFPGSVAMTIVKGKIYAKK
jgi:dihydroorotase